MGSLPEPAFAADRCVPKLATFGWRDFIDDLQCSITGNWTQVNLKFHPLHRQRNRFVSVDAPVSPTAWKTMCLALFAIALEHRARSNAC
jgi:hypothetical protein